MNRHDVENGIHRSWSFLEALALAESFSNPGILPINEEFRDISLDISTKYTSLYLTGLRLSHYNVLLSDHSFLQFGGEDGSNLRYAYYPNPFASPGEGIAKFKKIRELFDADLITLEQYHALLNDAQPELRVPLMRYENAPSQWRALKHPCSHFHIGHHSDNRWALKRILTPLAFTMIIAKQYYPDEWTLADGIDENNFENSLEGKLIAERQNCQIIGDDLFTDPEERSFHFF